MTRTVTALYDTRAEAEAAKQRLSSAVDVESARIIDQHEEGSSLGSMGLPDEDRHAYGEGIRRGGCLLCAEVDSDEDADKIVRVLEDTSSVDLDDRQNSWRSEGWAPFSGSSGIGDRENRMEGRETQEERIPIVEEQLNVGKREVNRGGARVRSYVKETPVSEQVNLREEHVSVERRPVTGDSSRNLGDRAFEERNIEMRETAEVPVVEKEAQITEEMVVRKTSEEHTENVQDTVRRTEVDVDETSGENRGSAFGFGSGESRSESRTDFERTDRDRDR
ncbi:MAG TPA: YsnF/AvaK domain-containing protein [Allosphingosinicella sp.]|nr:YsnF/AvaK domain-containing protein [Allosphingosinicella sp.]